MTYCTGIALNVLGLYSLTYSLMFYSLAVFVFVFPITDEGISFIEYVFRALGIIMVGVIHHLPVIAMLQSVGFFWHYWFGWLPYISCVRMYGIIY